MEYSCENLIAPAEQAFSHCLQKMQRPRSSEILPFFASIAPAGQRLAHL
jgi:hypothetical protein